jgi:hypothetical protein
LRGVEKEFPFRVGDGEDVASAADDDVGVEAEGAAMRGFLEEEEFLFLDRDFHAVGSMAAQGAGDGAFENGLHREEEGAGAAGAGEVGESAVEEKHFAPAEGFALEGVPEGG